MAHANGANALLFAFDNNGKPVNAPAFIVQEPIVEMTIHTNIECPFEIKYDQNRPDFIEIYSRQYLAKTGYEYCYQVRGYATSVQDLATKFHAFAKEAQADKEAYQLSRLDEMQAEAMQ